MTSDFNSSMSSEFSLTGRPATSLHPTINGNLKCGRLAGSPASRFAGKFWRNASSGLLAAALAWISSGVLSAQDKPTGDRDGGPKDAFVSNAFQLTFESRRAGEGYFSADGKLMVYQAEQEPGNPFYQIYLLDLETGETTRVSPGHGKTTCSWVHPQGHQVLFASTHADPDSKQKQRAELELRESGKQKRYEWDYDPAFDLYEYDRQTQTYRQLTTERGYDAEGSYSPDGRYIAFASNRRAFDGNLPPEKAKHFELDPSLMMDIYIMDADGTNVKQLTNTLGYDGGPFFSADGQRICWRRFSEDGKIAEIFTMNLDGSDQRQLTKMNAMSWAPSFHPSGKYLIFNTNVHGFDNFELYLVDADGKSAPVRVTQTPGFDGLATFDRAGERLTWASTRNSSNNKLSQIFLADWDHAAALKALGLSESETASPEDLASQAQGVAAAEATVVDFTPVDFRKHVEFLCQPELEGRMTGTAGERKATAYVAAYLDHLGLEPAGTAGSWYQNFEFPAGAKLGPQNSLQVAGKKMILEQEWRPLSFSKTGEIAGSPVVMVGYGIVAPEDGTLPAYDSYAGLDVKDKWVVMFRYFPENVSDQLRQHLQYHSSLRKKAMDARDKGARGIVIVNGPNSAANSELVPLEKDFSLAGSSIAAISVTDAVVDQWLADSGRSLADWQTEWDTGKELAGFELPGLKIAASIDVQQQVGIGRNVVGRLKVGSAPAAEAVLIGAHIDHLGNGRSSNSLARANEATLIHFGADDNASGVAAMLEIAEFFARQQREGKLSLQRDLIFAAWSGEELGLQGSQHFVETWQADASPGNNGAEGKANGKIVAALNMDMVGRYEGTLILQGIGSSNYWRKVVQKLNLTTKLNLKLSDDTSLPTDASSFYRAGIPILSAFTGSHQDYHTPRDTPEKLKYPEAARIAKFMGLVAMNLAAEAEVPDYKENKTAGPTQPRGNMRAYVGSIPDYAGEAVGVLLSGVSEGSPAEKAGVKGGDVIVEFSGRKIENIYDYVYALEGIKPGVETTIVVQRDGKRVELKITPVRR